MTTIVDLLTAIATILRDEPSLRRLAPNWAATDARAHVFVGAPPAGAANAGRAPYAVLGVERGGQTPRRQGDRSDAIATAVVALTLVHPTDAAGMANAVADALHAESNRGLGDPAHVLGLAVEHGPIAALGPCETTTLRLAVRLLEQPGS